MPDYYADSNVLVKRHVPETGSAWFHGLANPAAGNVLLTSRLSLSEVYSALNRRLREGTISSVDYATFAADFEILCSTQFRVSRLVGRLYVRARRLLEAHPLRALDALQLASALTANAGLLRRRLDPLIFLTADTRLLAAAQAEGLATDDPNAHP